MTDRAKAALGDQPLPRVTPGAVLDLGHQRFLVLGRTDWHLVERDQSLSSGWICDCLHWIYRLQRFGLPCRHQDDLNDWLRRKRATEALAQGSHQWI